MTTSYSPATYGEIQPHRAVVRPVLAVDPGNRFTKWIDCQTVRSIPSYVKELADWEEGGSDGHSYEIGFDGKRYLVGRLAQLMGGSPAFESGKADLAHLLILPALASDSLQRIERLVIPTPDSRNQQTIAKLKELETTIEFSVNGHDCLTTIRSVVAIDECRGAYDLALGRQRWRCPPNPNGTLGTGGGRGRRPGSLGPRAGASDVAVSPKPQRHFRYRRRNCDRPIVCPWWRFAPGCRYCPTRYVAPSATVSSRHLA